jgi:hypothetical protein
MVNSQEYRKCESFALASIRILLLTRIKKERRRNRPVRLLAFANIQLNIRPRKRDAELVTCEADRLGMINFRFETKHCEPSDFPMMS